MTRSKTLIFCALTGITLVLGACTAQTQQQAHDANRTLYDVNRTLYNIKALERNLGRF